ncbi:MAG: hypothetical protein M3246_04680 [Actinomycetota bacterium]|nr:hypothetical protein [Actinomycetota bacterium]HZY56566.1 hypothetical protein [Rubrobacteraceae bacterium]
MANGSDVNRMAERLASTTYDSYQAVVDHAVELQEQNVRFAQSLVECWIRELRRQSERNWEMAQELVDRAEEQSDAFQGFVEESIDAYVKNFPYTPFSY